MSSKGGMKFVDKYDVAAASIYKGNTENLKIPDKKHFLYDPSAPTTFDPFLVETIDRDGKMTTPIEVFTDPDSHTLWVIDGRSRALAVKEVNRRRAAEGRELVEPYIVPYSCDEKQAVLRMAEKNFHRREMVPSAIGTYMQRLRQAGHSWEAICRALHIETEDAMQTCRRYIPLAFCTDDVRAAIDSRDLPVSAAHEFAGHNLEGQDALGPKEQAKLLEEKLSTRQAVKAEKKAAKDEHRKATVKLGKGVVGQVGQKRVLEVFARPETKKGLDDESIVVVEVMDRVINRLMGVEDALSDWPAVAKIFDAALLKKPGRPPKADKGEAKAKKPGNAKKAA